MSGSCSPPPSRTRCRRRSSGGASGSTSAASRSRTSSAHLVRIAAAEGVTLDPAAAHAIARQAEGSARDALSLLDQATVLGGRYGRRRHGPGAARRAPRPRSSTRSPTWSRWATCAGPSRSVGRLVHDGQDLRNVTGEALGHFRDLLLVKTAPGQQDLLDIPADAYETLRVQAEKFTRRRARAHHRPAPRGAERHALDHLAAVHARARAGPRVPSRRPTRRRPGSWPGSSAWSGWRTSRPGAVGRRCAASEPNRPRSPSRGPPSRRPSRRRREPARRDPPTPADRRARRRRCPSRTPPTPAASTPRCSAGRGGA